jgi:hypothetical protein
MTKIALFGAGGKMGRRLSARLKDREYDTRYVEIGEEGIRVLGELGVSVTPQKEAIRDADAAIFAVPYGLLGKITADVVPQLRSGAMAMFLDVAAALAGVLHIREDVAYFFFHPAHRNILKPKREGEHIVCALMHGADEHYRLGERIARDIYAPVIEAHRLTVEQMGLLEPALGETIAAACGSMLREAADAVIEQGVPRVAVEEFLLGHMTSLAAFFGNGWLSEGAVVAMERGKRRLFKEGWQKLVTPDDVMEQSKAIIAACTSDT